MPWELNDYVFDVLDNIHRSMNQSGPVGLVIPQDPKAFGQCFQIFFEDRMAAIAAQDKPTYNSDGKIVDNSLVGQNVSLAV